MAGLGGYGSYAKVSPTGKLGPGGAKPNTGSQTLSQYGTPLSQTSQQMTSPAAVPNPNIYQGADANYVRNIATSYTPEQMAQMKTAATNVNAAGSRGMTDRLRELMAAQGLSGGGAEAGRMQSAMLGNNAQLANTMSNIDISNAQTGLSNQYQKAGMLSNLMGLGLNENAQAIGQDQFGKGMYSDMYKWGNQFDYQKQQDTQSNNQYQQQLELMLKQLGLGGGGSSYQGSGNVNRSRG